MKLNTIYCADCLDLMREIPDGSIDMILCDLPYGTTSNKWDTIIPLEPLWKEYARIIKDNGAIVLTSQPPFDKILGSSNIKLFKYEWVWIKNIATGHLNSKKMPLKQHENILIFYKHLPIYNPQDIIKKNIPTIRKGRDNGTNYGISNKDAIQKYENYPKDIIHFNMDSVKLHPTQKPVALFEYLIKTYTCEGDVVLDNCIGSGTTAVACINTKRNFIGIEKDTDYFNIAQKRIKELQEQMELI